MRGAAARAHPFLPRYVTADRYLDQAAEMFAGDIVVAEDLATVPVRCEWVIFS